MPLKRLALSCLLLPSFIGGPAMAEAPAAPAAEMTSTASCQGHGEFLYAKPGWTAFIRRVPGDIKDDWGETFAKRNLAALGLTVVATAVLIPADQRLIGNARTTGRQWDIRPTTYQKNVFLGLQGPFDSGSALYYVGDGTFHIGLAGGFLAYGGIRGDNRALQTSSQIAEAYLASGIVCRALKYATGRESPYVATRDGGRWVPFPSPKAALASANMYDAFPSGHLTSAMSVFTVISENYGDDYPWIRPLGGAMLAGLGFQMMNNGVHWASDYPLALFMGYTFGQLAAHKGRIPKGSVLSRWEVAPQVVGGGVGLAAARKF